MRHLSLTRLEPLARHAHKARIAVVTVLLALSTAYAYHVTSRGFYANLDPGDDMSLYHEALGFAHSIGIVPVRVQGENAQSASRFEYSPRFANKVTVSRALEMLERTMERQDISTPIGERKLRSVATDPVAVDPWGENQILPVSGHAVMSAKHARER